MAIAALKRTSEARRDHHVGATSFSQLATSCVCGAQSAVYYFAPFRAYCSEHAPSQLGPDRA
jgi:hypothetical protein